MNEPVAELKDDSSISDAEALWRRIKAFKNWLDPNGHPTSAAFKDNTQDGRLSVHRSTLTTVAHVSDVYPDYGIWSVLAAVPRAYDQIVVGDPTPEDPSHAFVAPRPGAPERNRMQAARRMAEAAVMVRPIP